MGNSLRKRLKKITSSPDTTLLEYPGHEVSRGPIYSEGYADCNGIVLFNHQLVGLSHYDLIYGNPDIYVPKLINEVIGFSDVKELSAILIGGDKNHLNKNKDLLKNYGVPILREYCDDWANGKTVTLEDLKQGVKSRKNVLVIPETREVILHISFYGYKRFRA